MEFKNAKKCHICERKLEDNSPMIEKDIRILNKKIIDIICSILLKIEDEDRKKRTL